MSNKINFFSKTKYGLRCEICPHLCVLKSGDRGKCRSRFNAGGMIKNVYDGTYSGITVSSIMEKPFYHFLKGSKTLSVGGFGCNLGCVFCLPPETLISTLEGAKRIDQIQDGEEIIVLDNSNDDQQLGLAHVGHVFCRESEEVIVLEVDGGRLELTPEHPVMTKNRGWVEAKDLTEDDEVLCDKTCLK